MHRKPQAIGSRNPITCNRKPNLPGALEAAQHATEIDPDIWLCLDARGGIAFQLWADTAGEDSARQGPARFLRGIQPHMRSSAFCSARKTKSPRPKSAFENAMAIDGALGNAWLGRGLCLIRQGKNEDGRRDLQVAAALEPNRAFFHSYLGKAFSNDGNEPKARLGFGARENAGPEGSDAVDLFGDRKQAGQPDQRSGARSWRSLVELNDNRRVYRSQFLLDQDRAVRSANLAAIYQANGMEDRECARSRPAAWTRITANASSHLFLANSYNALRDPKRINLRYETPWFNELLAGKSALPRSVAAPCHSSFRSRNTRSSSRPTGSGSVPRQPTSAPANFANRIAIRHVRKLQLLARHGISIQQRPPAEQ